MTDRGSASIELAAGLGLLLLPLAVAVLVAPAWVSARTVASAAAEGAGRIIATGPGTASSEAAAHAFVAEVVGAYGYQDVEVRLCPGVGTCLPLVRDGVVTVEVDVLVPAIDLPGVGTYGARRISASSFTRVDPYRSLP